MTTCLYPFLSRSMHFVVLFAISSLFVSILSESDVKSKLKCPVIGDNIVFCFPDEHHMNRGDLLKTLPKLGKEWEVSLEFKATKSALSRPTEPTDQANIIQLQIPNLTTKYGGSIVSISTKPDQDLYFSSFLSDQDGEQMIAAFNGIQLVDKWTSIRVSQQRIQINGEKSMEYRQTIEIDGRPVARRPIPVPKEFTNVRVFASGHEFPAQSGYIRNFVIQDGITGVHNFYV